MLVKKNCKYANDYNVANIDRTWNIDIEGINLTYKQLVIYGVVANKAVKIYGKSSIYCMETMFEGSQEECEYYITKLREVLNQEPVMNIGEIIERDILMEQFFDRKES